MTESAILDELIRREGGYVDAPNDRGGPTNHGITQARLAAWRGRAVTRDDVRELDEDEAREIYAELYIRGPRFDHIADPLLRLYVIDAGVQHGQTRAARMLQEAIGGVAVDGRVGALTLGALAQRDPLAVLLRMVVIRAEFYGGIIAANYRARRRGETSQDQAEFARGWNRRAVLPLRELAERFEGDRQKEHAA